MKPYLNLEYFYSKIFNFLKDGIEIFVGQKFDFLTAFSRIRIIGIILSALFLAGIIYNVVKWLKTNKKHISELTKMAIEKMPEERNAQWEKIKNYLDSDNPSDWKWAIMEADNLLDDIIKKIGYAGETFGERLSKIKPSQFKNLEEIWRAHKVRNRIAHEGENLKLTKDDAEYVMSLYKKALSELEYL